MCEMACQIVQKNLEEKQLEEEQAVKAQSWKLSVCYDDDDDEESSNSLEDNIISELPPYSAVTHTEPIDSLGMGDEHLNIISVTESDEFIKSCVENLVPNPSESEGENECDSLSDEDVPEKIYSNPLFYEEIIPIEIDQHSLNAGSALIESMPNHDSSITISSKIDSLFDEFAGELTLLKSISLGIDETDCHPEEEICLAKRLFDSHMKEIDLSFNPDDPMPPGIEDDDYDSGRGITGTLNIKMMGAVFDQKVKDKQEKDKIRPKPNKNEKHGEAGKRKANVVADALSRKERVPLRVRALVMT
nr:hypothetical protein [Tanacetum cinerariifolium]